MNRKKLNKLKDWIDGEYPCIGEPMPDGLSDKEQEEWNENWCFPQMQCGVCCYNDSGNEDIDTHSNNDCMLRLIEELAYTNGAAKSRKINDAKLRKSLARLLQDLFPDCYVDLLDGGIIEIEKEELDETETE